jgi:squalene synthase HpnC
MDTAIAFAKNHYENFPVVSFLIPKKLQKHVAIIYWFARTADDFADEGELNSEERLKKINDFEEELNSTLEGNPKNEFQSALAKTIKDKNLTPQLFYDLLKAFKQDVIKKRYRDFNEVLEYCKNSANPVGRLILELFDIRNEKAFQYSDKICTALQLTNFYQDTIIDYKKGRIYFPEEEMQKFSVSPKSFELRENNINLKQLVKFNVERTVALFDEGKNLLDHLQGRLKFEIKWTILGGKAILDKIKKQDYNVLHYSPELSKTDFIRLFFRAVFSK